MTRGAKGAPIGASNSKIFYETKKVIPFPHKIFLFKYSFQDIRYFLLKKKLKLL